MFTHFMITDEYIRAFIATLAIAINASAAGTLTVFRRASFLIAGASHSALAGVALAIFLSSFGFKIGYFFPALIFAVVSAILAANSKDLNTGIAITFALSMSIAVLLLSMTKEFAAKVWTFLFGDLLLLTDFDLFLMTASTSLVVLILVILYRHFLFVSFDPEGADAFGINVKLIDYTLVSVISISVVAALKAIGAILVFAMFVAPAAASKEIARNIAEVFYISFVIAALSVLISVFISMSYPIPAGAFAALIVSIIYFFIIFLKKSS